MSLNNHLIQREIKLVFKFGILQAINLKGV